MREFPSECREANTFFRPQPLCVFSLVPLWGFAQLLCLAEQIKFCDHVEVAISQVSSVACIPWFTFPGHKVPPVVRKGRRRSEEANTRVEELEWDPLETCGSIRHGRVTFQACFSRLPILSVSPRLIVTNPFYDRGSTYFCLLSLLNPRALDLNTRSRPKTRREIQLKILSR